MSRMADTRLSHAGVALLTLSCSFGSVAQARCVCFCLRHFGAFIAVSSEEVCE